MRVNTRYINFTRGTSCVYLVFTRMPSESFCRRLRSLLLYLCYVFRAQINSLSVENVGEFCKGQLYRSENSAIEQLSSSSYYYYHHHHHHQSRVLSTEGWLIHRAVLGSALTRLVDRKNRLERIVIFFSVPLRPQGLLGTGA